MESPIATEALRRTPEGSAPVDAEFSSHGVEAGRLVITTLAEGRHARHDGGSGGPIPRSEGVVPRSMAAGERRGVEAANERKATIAPTRRPRRAGHLSARFKSDGSPDSTPGVVKNYRTSCRERSEVCPAPHKTTPTYWIDKCETQVYYVLTLTKIIRVRVT